MASFKEDFMKALMKDMTGAVAENNWKRTDQQASTVALDMGALWVKYGDSIRKLGVEELMKFTVSGVHTKKILMEEATANGKGIDLVPGPPGIVFNMSPNLGPDELNFQRMSALVSYNILSRSNDQTFMDSLEPSALLARVPNLKSGLFEDLLKYAAGPGWGFVYRMLFEGPNPLFPRKKEEEGEPSTPVGRSKKKGGNDEKKGKKEDPRDTMKGAYLATAVVLDWASYCRMKVKKGLSQVSLETFAKDSALISAQQGAILQMTRNSGGGDDVFTLGSSGLEAYRYICHHDVYLEIKGGAQRKVQTGISRITDNM